jgi:hypothetical protein
MLSMLKKLSCLFLFLIFPVLLFSACSLIPTPPPIVHCEAMRPYVQYQGIYYYSTATNLKNSDLGNVVTTVGDGATHATSCLLDPGTPLYSIKGYPTTSRLASSSDGQITLFEVITLNPSPTISALKSIIGVQRTHGLEGTERNSLQESGIAFSGNA